MRRVPVVLALAALLAGCSAEWSAAHRPGCGAGTVG